MRRWSVAGACAAACLASPADADADALCEGAPSEHPAASTSHSTPQAKDEPAARTGGE
jgi:hypothetical protein